MYGGVLVARSIWERSEARADPELDRQETWSPIYGFARRCLALATQFSEIVLVDPTTFEPEAGTASVYGQQPDVDAFNLAPFAYVSYPQPVRPLGHASPAGTFSGPRDRVVAVWEQTQYRSDLARQAARITTDGLLADGYEQICQYTDPLRGIGRMFVDRRATEVRADAAATITPVRSHAALNQLLTLLGLLALCSLGACTAWIIAPGTASDLVIACALPLGCVIASLELLTLALLGRTWSLASVLSPCACLLLVSVGLEWRHQHARKPQAGAQRALRPQGRGAPIPQLLLLSVALAVVYAAPRHLPYSDGFMFYHFKAQAFFDDRSVLPYYQHASSWLFTLPAHPPLVSLILAWLYLFIGSIDEQATQLFWVAMLFSGLSLYYWLVRRHLSRTEALWSALALALGGRLAPIALFSGFADLHLAVMTLTGAGLTSYAIQSGNLRLLVLSSICLGGAVLTKEEGLPLALFVAAASWLLAKGTDAERRAGPRVLAIPLFLAGMCLIWAGPWWVLRLTQHIPETLLDIRANAATALARDFAFAAVGFCARAAVYWLAVAAMALSAFVYHRNQGRLRELTEQRTLMFLMLIVLAQAAVDVLGIAISPVDVHTQVRVAATRLLSQLTPLVAWAASILWSLHADEMASTETSVGGIAPR